MGTYKYFFPTGGYYPVEDDVSMEDAGNQLQELYPAGFYQNFSPMQREEDIRQREADNQGFFMDVVGEPILTGLERHLTTLPLAGRLAHDFATATKEQMNDPRHLQQYRDDFAAMSQEKQKHTFRQASELIARGEFTDSAKELGMSGLENFFGMLAHWAPTIASSKLGAAAGTAIAPGPGTLAGGMIGYSAMSADQFLAENLMESIQSNPDITLNDIADRFPHLLLATAGQVATEAVAFKVLGLFSNKLLGSIPKNAPIKRELVNSTQRKIASITGPRSTVPRNIAQGAVGEGGAEVLQHIMTKWQANVPIDYAEEDHMWELMENFWGGLSGGAGIGAMTSLIDGRNPQTSKRDKDLQDEKIKSWAHARARTAQLETQRLEAENRDKQAQAAENSQLEAELINEQIDVDRNEGRSVVSEEDIHAAALERNINSRDGGFIDFVRRTFPSHEGQIDSLSDLSLQEKNILYQNLKRFQRQGATGTGESQPVSFRAHSDSDIEKVTDSIAKRFKRHKNKAKLFTVEDVKKILGDASDERAKSLIEELRVNGVVENEGVTETLERLTKKHREDSVDYDNDFEPDYTAQQLSDLSEEASNWNEGDNISPELGRLILDNSGYVLNDAQVDPNTRAILDIARETTTFPTWEEIQRRTKGSSQAETVLKSQYDEVVEKLKADGSLQTNADGELFLASRYEQGVVGRQYRGVERGKFVVRALDGSIISVHDTIEGAKQSAHEANEDKGGGGYDLTDDFGNTTRITGRKSKERALAFIRQHKNSKYKIYVDGVEAESNLSKTKAEKLSRWMRSTNGLTGQEGRRRITVGRDESSFQFRSTPDSYLNKLPDVISAGNTKENLFVVEETKLGEQGRYLGSKLIGLADTLADAESKANNFRDLRRKSFDSVGGKIVEEDADLADLRNDPIGHATRRVREESPHLSEPITPSESKIYKAEMTEYGKRLEKYFNRAKLGHYGIGLQFVHNMQDLASSLKNGEDGWFSTQTGMITLLDRLEYSRIDANSSDEEVYQVLLPILGHEMMHAYETLGLIKPSEKRRILKRMEKIKNANGQTLADEVRERYRHLEGPELESEMLAVALEVYIKERGWSLTDKQKASKKKDITGADASVMSRIGTWLRGLGSYVNSSEWTGRDEKLMSKFVPGEERDSLTVRSARSGFRPFDSMEGTIRPERYTDGEKIVWDGDVNSRGDKWLTIVEVKDIHNLADAKGVPWDNDEEFMQKTMRLTGKSNHLDELNPRQRRLVYLDLADMQDPYNITETQRTVIPKEEKPRASAADEEGVDNEPYTYEEEYPDEAYAYDDEYGMGSRPIEEARKHMKENANVSVNIERMYEQENVGIWDEKQQEIILRELIQNAWDAVKGAYRNGIIDEGSGVINVEIESPNDYTILEPEGKVQSKKTMDYDDLESLFDGMDGDVELVLSNMRKMGSIEENNTFTYSGSMEVQDSGTGMSPEDITYHFLNIKGSSKPSTEASETSGGWGDAKMRFLFNPSLIVVESTQNGLTTRIVSDSRTLIESSTDVNIVLPHSVEQAWNYGTSMGPTWSDGRFDSGTSVKVFLPVDMPVKHVNSKQRKDVKWTNHPRFMSFPLIGDVKVDLIVDGVRTDPKEDYDAPGNREIPGMGKDLDIGGKYEEPVRYNADWGYIDVYKGPFVTRQVEPGDNFSTAPVYVFSSGLYQFDTRGPQRSGDTEFSGRVDKAFRFDASHVIGRLLNREILLDVHSNVRPGEGDYPFPKSRDSLMEEAKELTTIIARDIVGERRDLDRKDFTVKMGDATYMNRTNDPVQQGFVHMDDEGNAIEPSDDTLNNDLPLLYNFSTIDNEDITNKQMEFIGGLGNIFRDFIVDIDEKDIQELGSHRKTMEYPMRKREKIGNWSTAIAIAPKSDWAGLNMFKTFSDSSLDPDSSDFKGFSGIMLIDPFKYNFTKYLEQYISKNQDILDMNSHATTAQQLSLVSLLQKTNLETYATTWANAIYSTMAHEALHVNHRSHSPERFIIALEKFISEGVPLHNLQVHIDSLSELFTQNLNEYIELKEMYDGANAKSDIGILEGTELPKQKPILNQDDRGLNTTRDTRSAERTGGRQRTGESVPLGERGSRSNERRGVSRLRKGIVGEKGKASRNNTSAGGSSWRNPAHVGQPDLINNPISTKDGNRKIDIDKKGFHLPTYLRSVIESVVQHYALSRKDEYNNTYGKQRFTPEREQSLIGQYNNISIEPSRDDHPRFQQHDPKDGYTTNTEIFKEYVSKYIADVIASDLGIQTAGTDFVNDENLGAAIDEVIHEHHVNMIAMGIKDSRFRLDNGYGLGSTQAEWDAATSIEKELIIEEIIELQVESIADEEFGTGDKAIPITIDQVRDAVFKIQTGRKWRKGQDSDRPIRNSVIEKFRIRNDKDGGRLKVIEKSFVRFTGQGRYEEKGKASRGNQGVVVTPDDVSMLSELTLFHGGDSVLKSLRSGSEGGSLGSGIYLTPTREKAEGYGKNLYSVNVKIDNPLIISSSRDVTAKATQPLNWAGSNTAPRWLNPAEHLLIKLGVPSEKAHSIVEKEEEEYGYVRNRIRSLARRQGYDGILQFIDGELMEVVAFSKGQVSNVADAIGEEKGMANIPKRERERLERDRLEAIEQLPPDERRRVKERDRIAKANSLATKARRKEEAAAKKVVDDERELLERDIDTTMSRGRDLGNMPVQILTLKHTPTGTSIDIHKYPKASDTLPSIVGVDIPVRSEGLGSAAILMDYARDIYPDIRVELGTGDATVPNAKRVTLIRDLSTDQIRKLIEVNEMLKERSPNNTSNYESEEYIQVLANRGERGKASRGFDTTLPDQFRAKKLTFNKNTLDMMVKEAKSIAINKIKSRSYPDLKGTEKDRRIKDMVSRQQRYYNDIIRDDNIAMKVDVVSKLSNLYSSNQSATNHGVNSSDLYQFLKELSDAGVSSNRVFKIKNDMYDSMGMETRKIKINDLERNLLDDVSKIQFSQELLETKTPFSSIQQLMDDFKERSLTTTPRTQNINGSTAYFIGNELGFTEPIAIFMKPSGFRDMSIVEIVSNAEYGSRNIEYAGEGSPPLHGAEATVRTAMIMLDPSLGSKVAQSTEKGRASLGYNSTVHSTEEQAIMAKVHAPVKHSIFNQLKMFFADDSFREQKLLDTREGLVFKYDPIEKTSDEVRRRALDRDPENPVLLSDTGLGDVILAQKGNGLLAASLKYGVPIFDKVAGLTQAKLGSFKLQNIEGLPPIYEKEFGGMIDILGPAISDYGIREDLMRKVHVVLLATRGRRFIKEKKLIPEGINPEYLALADKFLKTNPEIQAIVHNYQRWNEAMIDYGVATEYLSEEQGAALKKNMDYVSFKRQSMNMEDQLLDHDSLFNQELQEGLKGDLQDLKQPPRYKGSRYGLIEGFLEGASLNAFTMIQRGLNNRASKSVINDQKIIFPDQVRRAGEGKDANGVDNNKLRDMNGELPTMIVRENGEEVTYVIADARVANAMKGSIGIRDPFVDGVMARFSAVLRKGVTIAPEFIYRNTLKDPMVNALIGGQFKGWKALTLPFVVAGNAVSHLAGGSSYYTKEFLELESVGGASGIYNDALYAPTPEGFNNMLGDQKRGKIGLNPKKTFFAIWDGLGVASTKSETATRERVYDSVLNETGSLKEALIQGIEVMNYDRRGGNQNFARYASMATFLSASINGWDIADRTLRKGTYSIDANQNNNEARKRAWYRVGAMAALSVGYALAWAGGDDDEWRSFGDEVRYSNWLVPFFGSAIAVGLPFELGVLTKVIPELAVRTMLKGMDPSEAAMILLGQVWGAAPNIAMPTALAGMINIGGSPWSESRGWNPFLKSPIIPDHMPVGPMAYDNKTSLTARGLATMLPGGSSPKKWEHLVSMYGGTMAVNILAIADTLVDQLMPGFAATPYTEAFENIPTVRAILKHPDGASHINKFHKWFKQVEDLTHEVRVLSIENPAKGRKLKEANRTTLKYAPMAQSVKSRLQKLDRKARIIRANKHMGSSERTKALERIRLMKLTEVQRFNKKIEGKDYKHMSYSGRTY